MAAPPQHITFVPKASIKDTASIVGGVLLPLVSRGLIVRRPPVVGGAARLDLDRRAVRRLQRAHERYGPGPLLLRLPFRRVAVILDPEDAQRVLATSPHPFSPANVEKEHALSQFQPEGVLISEGEEREDRRRFNEQVLDETQPIHRQSDHMVRVIDEEVDRLLERCGGTLTWDDHIEAWYRVVRRVVFGDGAADDHEVTELLGELRAAANWSVLRPTKRRTRRRFLDRVEHHLRRAEPGSLAATIAATPTTERTKPEQQVPQWLFAFDPAGMTTYRSLALLTTHPSEGARAREEVETWDGGSATLPFLRATVLESLRLWPTTPGILRDTTRHTLWRGRALPAGSAVLIHAPYFHRDDRALPEADPFAPELWDGDRPRRDWPLVPFSDGPAICPGRNVVLHTTSTYLATLLRRVEAAPASELPIGPGKPAPSVLDPFPVEFELTAR
jgi:cytochrome P450